MIKGAIAIGAAEILASLYERASRGEKPPWWLTKGIVPWDFRNPVYHLWYWIGQHEAMSDTPATMLEYPEIRAQMINRWNAKFWKPLYESVCSLSLPDYNLSLHQVYLKIKDMESVYGADFIVPWYKPTIDVVEYIERRAALGCPVSAKDPPAFSKVRFGFWLAISSVAIVSA
jgi:hypothetical protein